MPGLQDAQGLRREAPPTTDQTHGPKWSMFWREPTRGTQLRDIGYDLFWVWAVGGGGASRFGHCASCKSGNSVLNLVIHK